jgi:hypothetical protein
MLTYFLQVNLCWLLFYALYYVLLSKETFFTLNRIYLIISLLCGLLIPLSISKVETLPPSQIVEMMQPIAVSMVEFQDNIEASIVEAQQETWSIWTILMGIYGLGMAFFLLKFGIGLYKVFQLYQRGEKHPQHRFTLINTEGVTTPFSFFKWIFINDTIAKNADFQHIIIHEKAHVVQKHSFDIVGLEILRGLFWVSPLVHSYARSLRHVHEYLADAAVLQNTEKKQYGRLLIHQTAAGSGLILANHFNFSQLKKRIVMMSRNLSQRVMLMKYFLAVPMFLLLIVAFTIPNSPLMSHTEGVSRELENTVNNVENGIKNNLQDIDNQNIKNDCLTETLVSLECEASGYWTAERLQNHTFLNVKKDHTLLSFQLIRYNKNHEIVGSVSNQGAVFNKEVLDMIAKAQLGDNYLFLDFKVLAHDTKNETVWGTINIQISDKNIPRKNILQYWLYDKDNYMISDNNMDYKAFKNLRKVLVLQKYEIVEPIKITKWTTDWVMGSNKGMIEYQAKTNSPYFDNETLAMLENTKIGESYSFRWTQKSKQSGLTMEAMFYIKANSSETNPKDDRIPYRKIETQQDFKIWLKNLYTWSNNGGHTNKQLKVFLKKEYDVNFEKATPVVNAPIFELNSVNTILKPNSYIALIKTEGKSEYLEYNFNIQENNIPHAILNTGKSGGSITYDILNATTHIIFKVKGSDKIFNCKNIEIAVRRDPADGSGIEEVKNEGAVFNEKVKALFKKAKLNDSYSFRYINVEDGENSKKYTLPMNLFTVMPDINNVPKEVSKLPIPILGKYKSGKIPLAEFKSMKELSLQIVDNHVIGKITSYRMIWMPTHETDAIETKMRSMTFTENTLELIKKAKVGDNYMFYNIIYTTQDNQDIPLQNLNLVIE